GAGGPAQRAAGELRAQHGRGPVGGGAAAARGRGGRAGRGRGRGRRGDWLRGHGCGHDGPREGADASAETDGRVPRVQERVRVDGLDLYAREHVLDQVDGRCRASEGLDTCMGEEEWPCIHARRNTNAQLGTRASLAHRAALSPGFPSPRDDPPRDPRRRFVQPEASHRLPACTSPCYPRTRVVIN
ncbi:hypothetical protein TPAR_01084, partial [Tolypocladium paradoxum]